MGMFNVDMELSPLWGPGSVTVSALVDTGATFCMAPKSMLERIGLVPTDTMSFGIADGSSIMRAICDARITVGDRTGVAPVIFGEETGPCLLGVIALERLSLAVDPSKKMLVPTEAILYKATGNGDTS